MKTITVEGMIFAINDPSLRVVLQHGITVKLLAHGPHGEAGRVVGLSTSVGLSLIEQGLAEYAGA